MKKLVIILSLVLLVGCTTTRTKQVGENNPILNDAFASLNSLNIPAQIRIVSISPDKNQKLNENSVIIAEVEYKVDIENTGYKLENLYIVPLTKNKKGPVRIYGSFPSTKYQITAPSGKMIIEFPLSHVWGLKNLEKPITLRFGISHRDMQGGFVLVGYVAETNSYYYE